jgi:hypothetical protein
MMTYPAVLFRLVYSIQLLVKNLFRDGFFNLNQSPFVYSLRLFSYNYIHMLARTKEYINIEKNGTASLRKKSQNLRGRERQ